MGLNQRQQEAVDATAKEDVIVNAGAGSGKTYTLSKKIYEMVNRGELKPNELLVLTFTNNAAHEMKDRIIRMFAEEHSPYADEMLSAHVQTFDSFSQYLVTTYSAKLGISDQVMIADQAVIDSKTEEFLDEILLSYYQDEEKRKRILKTLVKFNTKDDSKTRNVILDLYSQLEKMIPSERKTFVAEYEKNYLSKDFYDKIRKEETGRFRFDLEKALRVYNFEYSKKENLKKDAEDVDALSISLEKGFYATCNLNDIDPSDDYRLTKPFIEGLIAALKNADDSEFVSQVKELYENKEADYFNGRKGAKDTKQGLKYVRDCIKDYSYLFLDYDEGLENYLSFKDDIFLLFDIVEELKDRLLDYERTTNTYTFTDISYMALRLLTESKFEDVAEKVRCQFKFIMVDEYQDTNDMQEVFLGSLLKTNRQGENAHLFVVGDAKQSIYAFRNSNVALFRRRIEEYSHGLANQKVIPMNTNYRSKPEVLSDINFIFKKYMTLTHGDIKYTNEMEQLIPGGVNQTVDPNREKKYGITRITISKDLSKFDHDNVKDECLAIILDIKEKMASKMMVEVKGKEHQVRYSDFCVLLRKKKNFSVYQKLFKEAGIPLNNIQSANLIEIDSILLLGSLLKALDYLINKTETDILHVYASIARSYAFQIRDDEIFDTILKCKNSLSPLFETEIMKKLIDFANANMNESFSMIFQRLLDEFSIISKLYLIGNVEDNVNKIESLFTMVKNKETSGEGLKEFVQLFDSLNKYELDLSSDSVFKSEDAVDLMTIHASKGLERPIVYMPVSDNVLSKGNPGQKPDYDFSKKYGIILPYYNYSHIVKDDDGNILPVNKYNLLHFAFANYRKTIDPDRNEHVRLVYVALTRAMNQIFIVGNDTKPEEYDSGRNYENLYGMLSYIPRKYKFLDEILISTDFKDRINPKLLGNLEKANARMAVFNNLKTRDDFDAADDLGYKTYMDMVDLVHRNYSDCLERCVDEIYDDIYHLLHKKVFDHDFTLDEKTKLFSGLDKTFDEFYASCPLSVSSDDESGDSDDSSASDDDTDSKGEEIIRLSKDDMQKLIEDFYDEISNIETFESSRFKCPSDIRNDSDKLFYFHRRALPYLLTFFNGIPELMETTYQEAGDYPDMHYEYLHDDLFKQEDGACLVLPAPKNVSDDVVEFKEKVHRRASKQIDIPLSDLDNYVQSVIENGVRLHRLLELVSFTTRDTSFIKDKKDREIIDRVLALSIFDGVTEENVKKEFTYYDEKNSTYGSVDLLMEKDGLYYIVDYKTNNIDDPHYEEQLLTYRDNLKDILKKEDKDFKMILLSILKGEAREVK